MGTLQVCLANLDEKKELTPNYPVTLDTEFKCDSADVTRVNNPLVVDAVIKLHALFTPHLVLHEAQILDHSGMRAFFNLLNTRSELQDALRYFTSPGADTLGLGPVILVSERYDRNDPRHAFPLDTLLARKLGADNPDRHPWELSSFWNARGGEERDQARLRIRETKPADRLSIAMELLEPAGAYRHYLGLASEVWDKRADITRIPLSPPDYAGQLKQLLLEHERGFDERTAETAAELRTLIDRGSLSGGELKQGINRSTVHMWLRKRSANQMLDTLATRAHPEAFVLAFPSRCGWNSTHDPGRLGFWRGPESASEPKPKRSLDRVASVVAENIRPLFLPNVKYSDLIKLRGSPDFHASLSRLTSAWNGYNLTHVEKVVQEHIKFIWKFLGYNKRSSVVCVDGPNVTIEVVKWVVEQISWAVGLSSTAATFGRGINPYTISFGPFCLIVKHLWTWITPTEDWRDMTQVARLIGRTAIQTKESNLR